MLMQPGQSLYVPRSVILYRYWCPHVCVCVFVSALNGVDNNDRSYKEYWNKKKICIINFACRWMWIFSFALLLCLCVYRIVAWTVSWVFCIRMFIIIFIILKLSVLYKLAAQTLYQLNVIINAVCTESYFFFQVRI